MQKCKVIRFQGDKNAVIAVVDSHASDEDIRAIIREDIGEEMEYVLDGKSDSMSIYRWLNDGQIDYNDAYIVEDVEFVGYGKLKQLKEKK